MDIATETGRRAEEKQKPGECEEPKHSLKKYLLDKNGRQVAPSADRESAWGTMAADKLGTTEARRMRTSTAARSMNNMKWREVEEPEEDY